MAIDCETVLMTLMALILLSPKPINCKVEREKEIVLSPMLVTVIGCVRLRTSERLLVTSPKKTTVWSIVLSMNMELIAK